MSLSKHIITRIGTWGKMTIKFILFQVIPMVSKRFGLKLKFVWYKNMVVIRTGDVADTVNLILSDFDKMLWVLIGNL
jgi:hypothetical protein